MNLVNEIIILPSRAMGVKTTLANSFTFGKLVKNETVKPAPTEYPPLLPTLQTVVGMVLNNGLPKQRGFHKAPENQLTSELTNIATSLRTRCPEIASKYSGSKKFTIDWNFEACSMLVTKDNLLDYISHGKRLDTEQAVAMVIAYLQHSFSGDASLEHGSEDDFEEEKVSAVDQLINDPGTVEMLHKTCMWREKEDFDLHGDSRDLAIISKKNKILMLLGEDVTHGGPSTTEFTKRLLNLRRRRQKLGNTQHLVLPDELMPDHVGSDNPWRLSNHYKHGTHAEVAAESPELIPKNLFRRIQRLLVEMGPPSDDTSRYVYDVQEFIKSSGRISGQRIAVLRKSTDPYAIAYSFITAQRHCQLKVVSDHGWKRFLIKGEGAFLLQNRPNVLTSFEDILVRHATDLVALTAVSCPQGLRDHFSTGTDILKRTRTVCELMERYVETFAPGGNMENLVFDPHVRGGSGRGPVDFYNALCDELADCRNRAKAAGLKLQIAPVHKFLAKDIMAWNDAWKDDAFAAGKEPGWLEYLARVRIQDMHLEDDGWVVEDKKKWLCI